MLRNLIRQFATNGTGTHRGRSSRIGSMTRFNGAGGGYRGRRGRSQGGAGASIGAAVERFIRTRRR